MKRAVILKNDETEENHVEIARSYFAEAAHSYMTAAETYPEDDELHVCQFRRSQLFLPSRSHAV